MTFKRVKSLIALLMSLVLIASIFTVSVFADDASDAAAKAIAEAKNTLIINGVIILAIIAIAAVLVIRFRKKLFDFLRTVKSEMKKIVWTSKENTRKSFLVVTVVAVAVALALFAIDEAFGFVVRTLSSLI